MDHDTSDKLHQPLATTQQDTDCKQDAMHHQRQRSAGLLCLIAMMRRHNITTTTTTYVLKRSRYM